MASARRLGRLGRFAIPAHRVARSQAARPPPSAPDGEKLSYEESIYYDLFVCLFVFTNVVRQILAALTRQGPPSIYLSLRVSLCVSVCPCVYL